MGWQWVEDSAEEKALNRYASVADRYCSNGHAPLKMVCLLDSYVCDICQPPKTLDEAKDFTSPSVLNKHVVSVNVGGVGGPYYLYSSRKGTQITASGYTVYDDLQALRQKLLLKAAAKGKSYYIYQIDAATELDDWAMSTGSGYSTSRQVPNHYKEEIFP